MLGQRFEVEVREGFRLRGGALRDGKFQSVGHFRWQRATAKAAGERAEAQATDGASAAEVLREAEAQHRAAGEAQRRGSLQERPVRLVKARVDGPATGARVVVGLEQVGDGEIRLGEGSGGFDELNFRCAGCG